MKIAGNNTPTHPHGIKLFFYMTLTLTLLFCFYPNCNAQNQNLRFEHLGMEQGMSNETVTNIFQDSKGYLWFGTWDGLNKYDGYTFTKYKFDHSNPNSLSSNFIYTIWEDQQGLIWLGTNDGLCKFDRYSEKFTRYKPDPKSKFTDPNISAINEDRNGMMWIGSFGGGLCRFNRRIGKFLPDSFGLKGVNSIIRGKAGDLWIGSSGGLHQLIVQPVTPDQLSEVKTNHYSPDLANPDGLSNVNVSCVFEDKTGILWLATDNGLNSFDKKRNSFRRYQHDPKNIHSISSNRMDAWFGETFAEDREGNLWIATKGGINKLNRDRNVFTRYSRDLTTAYSLSSDSISAIFIDRSGILWAGTWKGKLNKANLIQKPFEQRGNSPGNINSLSNNAVTAILEDTFGIVWIGTDGGGLNRWDRKTNQFNHYKHDPDNIKTLRSNIVNAILEDRDGQLWICNGEFISKLNKHKEEFIHYNSLEKKYNNSDQPKILSTTEDHDGVIWLGAHIRVINFDKKAGKFIKYYYHNEADSTSICDYGATTIFPDSRNNIWIGHGSKGTDRLNKRTGIITHYKHNPTDPASISSNVVNSFYEDTKRNLWLATQGGGLCHFNYQTGKFTTYTDKNGLPDNSVYSILEDNKNQLWLGTANGLSRFDPVTEKFTNYDEKDGLASRFFAAGNRDRSPRYKGKNGTFYFGGPNGFTFFHPDEIKADSTVVPVVITQFKLFDSLVKGANETNEIVLKHNENYFSFEFSSLSFANSEKNQYSYKLEGVDKDWVYSGSRRYVSYTNIDPGKYTFRVMGTNSDGIWNEVGTSISIIIKPPWYRTWWAYTLYALLFAGLVYAFIQYRINKIRMQHEIIVQKHKATELEMQSLRAQMNPHFIFNSLTSINRFILKNNQTQASEYLTKFSKLVRMILQNSQASFVPLESEMEALKLYLELEALRFDHHFQFNIIIEKDLDVSTIKVPPLIIQPYAENAIRHGLMQKEESGHLDIELSQEGDTLCCKITDDGIGRKKAAELKRKSASEHKSMGMQITADRIAALQQKNQMKTTIEITDLVLADASPGGTQVLLKIPLLYD